jgi:large subunit ribosomal protein L18
MPSRLIRRLRTKKKLNYNYPVVVVYKSNKNTTVQLLEPVTKRVIVGFVSNNLNNKTKTEKAVEVAKLLAEKIKQLNYSKVLFDRNGFLYHGRVKAVADTIRAAGIEI